MQPVQNFPLSASSRTYVPGQSGHDLHKQSNVIFLSLHSVLSLCLDNKHILPLDTGPVVLHIAQVRMAVAGNHPQKWARHTYRWNEQYLCYSYVNAPSLGHCVYILLEDLGMIALLPLCYLVSNHPWWESQSREMIGKVLNWCNLEEDARACNKERQN